MPKNHFFFYKTFFYILFKIAVERYNLRLHGCVFDADRAMKLHLCSACSEAVEP